MADTIEEKSSTPEKRNPVVESLADQVVDRVLVELLRVVRAELEARGVAAPDAVPAPAELVAQAGAAGAPKPQAPSTPEPTSAAASAEPKREARRESSGTDGPLPSSVAWVRGTLARLVGVEPEGEGAVKFFGAQVELAGRANVIDACLRVLERAGASSLDELAELYQRGGFADEDRAEPGF